MINSQLTFGHFCGFHFPFYYILARKFYAVSFEQNIAEVTNAFSSRYQKVDV